MTDKKHIKLANVKRKKLTDFLESKQSKFEANEKLTTKIDYYKLITFLEKTWKGKGYKTLNKIKNKYPYIFRDKTIKKITLTDRGLNVSSQFLNNNKTEIETLVRAKKVLSENVESWEDFANRKKVSISTVEQAVAEFYENNPELKVTDEDYDIKYKDYLDGKKWKNVKKNIKLSSQIKSLFSFHKKYPEGTTNYKSVSVDGRIYQFPSTIKTDNKINDYKEFIRVINKWKRNVTADNYLNLLRQQNRGVQNVLRNFRSYLKDEPISSREEGTQVKNVFKSLKIEDELGKKLTKIYINLR
jgi:hypothetical protein|tara:strand:+ start:45 stop:944 length:900 start_codon:yes stop_codon:yes gene_type:complete